MAEVTYAFDKDFTVKKVVTQTVVDERTITIDDLQIERDMLTKHTAEQQAFTNKRVAEIDADIAEIQKLGVQSQKAVIAEERRVALEAEISKINEEPLE